MIFLMPKFLFKKEKEMFCKNCGAQLPEGAGFCGSCGAKMEAQQPIQQPTQQPEQPIQPMQPMQQPVQQPPMQQPMQQQPPPMAAPPQRSRANSSKSPVKLIAIVAAIVIALGAAAYFVFFSGERDGDSSDGGVSGPRSIPNEARMMMELKDDGRSFIPRTQSIDSVEIINDETDREFWTHEASIVITSNDDEISYEQYALMSYYRNDEREWILSDISPEHTNRWTKTPIAGASMELIEASVRNSLLWQNVAIGGEEWYIDDSVIEGMTVSNQSTDLANRKDIVTVNVTLGSDVMTAEGQLELEFVFNEMWNYSNHRGAAPFASQYRPNADFTLTEEQLMDELVRGDASILREMHYEWNAITISRDEISNLSISDYESWNKGANRVYNFSFTAVKGIITYSVDAHVFYHFDNLGGWLPGAGNNSWGAPVQIGGDGVFAFEPKVESVELLNSRWVGTFNSSGYPAPPQTQLIIEINEVTSDGSVRATLTTLEPEVKQTSIGTFDMSGLALKLIFDDWIVEPSVNPPRNFFDTWINNHKLELNGRIDVSGTTLTRTSGTRFDVILSDTPADAAPATDTGDANGDDGGEDNGED